MFSIREILGIAVKLEKNGERFYRGSIARFSEPSIVGVLRWLADEELRHIDWFTARHSAMAPEKGEREIQEIGDELLHEIMGEQTFSLQEVDLSSIREPSALLDIAIEFENDTVLFYEMLHSLVDDRETTEMLVQIIAEEQSHIQSLQTIRPQVYKTYP